MGTTLLLYNLLSFFFFCILLICLLYMYVHVRICVPVCVLVGVHVSMSLYGHVGAGGVGERGTCMKYLPGRQILLPDTRFQAFLSPSMRLLGKFQFMGSIVSTA